MHVELYFVIMSSSFCVFLPLSFPWEEEWKRRLTKESWWIDRPFFLIYLQVYGEGFITIPKGTNLHAKERNLGKLFAAKRNVWFA